MAALTPAALRARARDALWAQGARGFVRFGQPGGALLLTDALRRLPDETTRANAQSALNKAGFLCRDAGSLLGIDPGDALLYALRDARDLAGFAVRDWQDASYAARSLAARWLAVPPQPLTDAGRALIIETTRQCWQTEVLPALDGVRAQAAAMLRAHDRSGMAQAGAVLARWCVAWDAPRSAEGASERQDGRHDRRETR